MEILFQAWYVYNNHISIPPLTLHVASDIQRFKHRRVTRQLEAMKYRIVEYVVKRKMTHEDVVRVLRTRHGIHTSLDTLKSFCFKYGMYIYLYYPTPSLTLHVALDIKRLSMTDELEAIKDKIVEYVVEREMTHVDVVRILFTDHGIHTNNRAVSHFCAKHGMYIYLYYPPHH